MHFILFFAVLKRSTERPLSSLSSLLAEGEAKRELAEAH
jgi:hypothetical protein